MMDDNTKRELLALARRAIESATTPMPAPETTAAAGREEPFSGVFVTLRKGPEGQLRGCIGTFQPSGTLPEAVVDYAKASALHDTRFTPIRPEEVDDLTIEISVLSPLEETDDPGSLEVGKHGVYLKAKGRGLPQTACFLPQVAVEQKWDAEQFLSALCSHKCRPPLPPDAWRDRDLTTVYLFTAEVFSERDLA